MYTSYVYIINIYVMYIICITYRYILLLLLFIIIIIVVVIIIIIIIIIVIIIIYQLSFTKFLQMLETHRNRGPQDKAESQYSVVLMKIAYSFHSCVSLYIM